MLLLTAVGCVVLGVGMGSLAPPMGAAAAVDVDAIASLLPPPLLTPGVILGTIILLAFSAFFSSSEVAFFSLHEIRLRSMRESSHPLDGLAGRLMDRPGNLLTSILMGNCVVNVLLGVVLGARLEQVFEQAVPWPHAASYILAVGISTGILVFFGEVTPKLLVVRRSESFARFAAAPMLVIDRLLMPIRHGLITLTGFLFRVTRFSEVPPAPFMTDAEFKVLLSEGEAFGVIEGDESQMIQGILAFSDVILREVLVPRPDMAVLPENATVGEALEAVREQEFSRIPVFRDDLDHITGILYAKDLLPGVVGGGLGESIQPLLRRAHFVPETMTVANFVKMAQRSRTHMAIVVDEFGGTEGLVTLQDALREVVGDIGEEGGTGKPPYEQLGEGSYRIEGSFPLDKLEALTGRPVKDEEHTTVAGFLMEQTEKILKAGDQIEHDSVRYTVEEMDGKRVTRLHVNVQATGLDAPSEPAEGNET